MAINYNSPMPQTYPHSKEQTASGKDCVVLDNRTAEPWKPPCPQAALRPAALSSASSAAWSDLSRYAAPLEPFNFLYLPLPTLHCPHLGPAACHQDTGEGGRCRSVRMPASSPSLLGSPAPWSHIKRAQPPPSLKSTSLVHAVSIQVPGPENSEVFDPSEFSECQRKPNHAFLMRFPNHFNQLYHHLRKKKTSVSKRRLGKSRSLVHGDSIKSTCHSTSLQPPPLT